MSMESYIPSISLGDVFSGLTLLIALWWVIWGASNGKAKRAEWRGKTETRLDGFEKRAETIETSIKEVHGDVGALKGDVARMRGDIKWLIDLITPGLSRDGKSITGASPLTLNKRGVELAESLGAFNTAKTLASKISVPANADHFEIQAAAYQYAVIKLMSAIDKKTRKKIQALAYEDSASL